MLSTLIKARVVRCFVFAVRNQRSAVFRPLTFNGGSGN